MKPNKNNYFSPEMNRLYMGHSQFLGFVKCEEAALRAIAKADEDMAACGTDFSKANEIFAEKTKLEEKLEALFEEWEELHS